MNFSDLGIKRSQFCQIKNIKLHIVADVKFQGKITRIEKYLWSFPLLRDTVTLRYQGDGMIG